MKVIEKNRKDQTNQEKQQNNIIKQKTKENEMNNHITTINSHK